MKIIYKLLIFFFISGLFISCDEEKPQDFFASSNAYITHAQFESGLIDIYARLRGFMWTGDVGMSQWLGTDIFKNGRWDPKSYARFGSYEVTYNETHFFVAGVWGNAYKVIANSNTIISRLEASSMTEDQKLEIGAEAKFFRAFAYRYLVYHFGDVPLLVNEVVEPKTDFVRTPKNEVLLQMVQDFKDAAFGMKGIGEVVDGKVSNLVAQHYLAETYVALEQWDDAISASTEVISDPSTGLMTERFGSMASDERGNAYWDLFRVGNQNRGSGNTEALWVCQMETDVLGGGLSSAGPWGCNLERYHCSLIWTLNDPDGEAGTLGARSSFNVGGRGINWLGITDYFEKNIWGDDYDIDTRSQNINLYRDFYYDNPNSAYFGKSMHEYPSPILETSVFRMQTYLTKATTAGQHPAELYSDPELQLLKSSAGATYRDQYNLRLAETYLIRAEAYLGKGDKTKAATDLTTVRARSNASIVGAADVTLDYILDERGRELSLEEPRRLTLHRTGKLVERVRKYNLLNTGDIADHNNLAPLPLGDIEANITGNLEQNPGY